MTEFIHRYVPTSAGQPPFRVLLLLHGTGGNEEDLLPLGHELDPTAAILSPRGRVLENGMPRFFRRLAEGVFDEEDVVVRADELADFVQEAAEQYGFDWRNVVAVGYSNGANIASATMLLRPEVLQRAVLFRAMVPLANPPQSDLSQHQVLISFGENDPIAPRSENERLAELLRGDGAEVSVVSQRAGHQLVRRDLEAAREWLTGAGLPRQLPGRTDDRED